ncbi:hypothetical protein ABIE89_002137 [Bradyrhizobium niftali]|uniref:hypothetical protein n=1 Tax=Bradyrhizobium niftali TaxID=2560055 RepID=UPI003836387F
MGWMRALGLVVLLGAISLSWSARAADWPPDTKWSCDDPFLVRKEPPILDWLPKDEPYLVSGAGGLSRASVSSRLLRDKLIELGKPTLEHQVRLSADQARMLSTVIRKHVEVLDIPWYVGYVLPGQIASNAIADAVIKKSFSGLRSLLVSKAKSLKASADSLADVVVGGGQLLEFGVLSQADDRYAWFQMIQYKVQIGDEARNYFLLSCQYPASVSISRVTGLKSDGSKGFIFQEDNGNDWSIRNADGSLQCVKINGETSCDRLKKVGEDPDFLYLRLVCAPNEICQDYKISLNGGEIWDKFDGGSWGDMEDGKPLYAKSVGE